ncbi:MAG: hypothetical protein CYG60_07300 [Actinobacteria bacterium]|nr:MAG: hypothetical protein CYG60_07300 [Actinomycetota bacterium]
MKRTHLMLAGLPKGAFSVPFPVSKTTPRKWRGASGCGIMLGVEVGYVRVSKREQSPEMQWRELSAAGCERVFEERISSRKESRPQLEAALDYCRQGDMVVV